MRVIGHGGVLRIPDGERRLIDGLAWTGGLMAWPVHSRKKEDVNNLSLSPLSCN